MDFRPLPIVLLVFSGWGLLCWSQATGYSILSGSIRGRVHSDINQITVGMPEDDVIYELERNSTRSGRLTIVRDQTACLYFQFTFSGMPREQVRVWLKASPTGYVVERVGEIEPYKGWNVEKLAVIASD